MWARSGIHSNTAKDLMVPGLSRPGCRWWRTSTPCPGSRGRTRRCFLPPFPQSCERSRRSWAAAPPCPGSSCSWAWLPLPTAGWAGPTGRWRSPAGPPRHHYRGGRPGQGGSINTDARLLNSWHLFLRYSMYQHLEKPYFVKFSLVYCIPIPRQCPEMLLLVCHIHYTILMPIIQSTRRLSLNLLHW